jgi:hypothetical protein
MMTISKLLGCVALLTILGGCDPGDGQRCNPLQFSDTANQGNCSNGELCLYPTAPNCGVAYCCKVDDKGNITDTNPNCQPDPASAAACMLDLSPEPVDAAPTD